MTIVVISLLSRQYVTELKHGRIRFTLETISVEDIPAPAIVLGAGEVYNPFGFVELHRETVGLGDLDHEGKLQSIEPDMLPQF